MIDSKALLKEVGRFLGKLADYNSVLHFLPPPLTDELDRMCAKIVDVRLAVMADAARLAVRVAELEAQLRATEILAGIADQRACLLCGARLEPLDACSCLKAEREAQ